MGCPLAFEFKLDNDEFTPYEKNKLLAFLDEVASYVPPQLKVAIRNPIIIHFDRNLDSSLQLKIPHYCSHTNTQKNKKDEKQVLGQTQQSWFSSKNTIQLNYLLKSEILKGPMNSQSFSCGHKNFYKTAMATVIHETTHIYDRQNNLSNSPQYLSLAGWVEIGAWGGPERLMTNEKAVFHSPDPYEYVNPQEHFAVNMEYFLLDPQYRNRRPALYLFFKTFFGFDSFSEAPFMPFTEVDLSFPQIGQRAISTADLNPDRIYGVDYLIAGHGETTSSTWGHSMLRLIICSPERTEVGPQCLNDINYHVVVSYRANVLDLILNYWKGLQGDYPSRLFLFSFMDIIDEYNRDDLRDLISIPLRLNDGEKKILIYHLLEQYLSYQGRYYFFGNNCSTECLNVLKAASQNTHLQTLLPGTAPWPLLRDLRNSQLIQEKEVLFPSERKNLENVFNLLARMVPHFSYSSLDTYLNFSSALERRQLFLTLATDDKKNMASFLYLETFFVRRAQRRLLEKFTEYIMRLSEKNDRVLGEQEILETIKHISHQNDTPYAECAYGMPNKTEAEIYSEQRKTSLEELGNSIQNLQSFIKSAFSEPWDEVENSQKNVDLFREKLLLRRGSV